MRKWLVCFFLLAGIVVASGVSNPLALAQATKRDRDAKKAGESAVIEVTEGKDGKFRFFVRAADGKLLAMSSPGGFATEKEARKGVEELKEVIGRAKVVTGKKKAATKSEK